MRVPMIFTVLGREWREIRRNRALLLTVSLPPVLLVGLPLAAAHFGGTHSYPASVIGQVLALHPTWSELSSDQLTAAFGLQQMSMFFLIMPAYIPLAIAAYSIVGEKQSRTLEAVLATPIRTSELLTGKTIAALVPGVLVTWFAFVVLILGVAALEGARVASVVLEPTWLVTVFVVGPAVGLVSVVLGVLISSRATDPRAAQQAGALVILPILGLVVTQMSSGAVIGVDTALRAAVVLLVIGIVGIRIGVRLFGRETILTRLR